MVRETLRSRLDPREVDIVRDLLEAELPQCEHLRTADDYYFYCGKDQPTVFDILERHQDVVSVQLYCMDRYQACMWHQGSFKFSDEPTE